MRTSCFVCLLLAATLLVPAGAQTGKHPITHEDVWLMKRLGGPIVSPDGKWVVTAVTEPAYDEKDQASDLWILPADGSASPRRLTATKAAESGVSFSPDGKFLAFSTRRENDESPQIHLLELGQPGEAQRLTNISTGARTPLWRPDGKAILFQSDVYPGAKTDEENRKAAQERRARKWNARVYDGFPIRDWDRWLDDRRPSLLVQGTEPGSEARDILAGSRLASSPGFGGQMGSGSENFAAVWTPDGKGVVFAATANRNEAAFADTVQSLFLVPAGGGEPKRLTADSDSYADPAFSRDGKTLFARMEPKTGRVYNAARLVRWSWPETGGRTIVTGTFDRSVGNFATTPDGRSVVFLAEDTGRQKLNVEMGTLSIIGCNLACTFALTGSPQFPQFPQ